MSRRPDDPIALNLARLVYKLITEPMGWRMDLLQKELGIADRTYRKYRKLLQEFPAFVRADGSSMIEQVREDDGTVWLRFVPVPAGEAAGRDHHAPRVAALHLAQQMFAFLRHTEVGDAFQALFADLGKRSRTRTWRYADLLVNASRLFHVVPDAPKDYSDQGDTLSILLRALIFKQRLGVLYYSASSDQERELTLEPLTLLSWRSALYLVARKAGQKKPRTFAVDRIREIELLPDLFAYPTEAEYSPEQVTEGAFGLFNEDARKKIDVDLVFDDVSWLKAHLTERRWHRSQRFQHLPDGRLRMRFRVTTMTEVWPWIRSHGPHVRILAPTPHDDTRAADLKSRYAPSVDGARFGRR